MQSLACPGHRQTSLSSRLTKARKLVSVPGTVNYMEFLLDPDWRMDPYAVSNLPDAEASLIHTAAEVTFRIVEQMCRNLVEETKARRWLTFAKDVIQKSQDLHVLEPKFPWETQFLMSDESCKFTPLVRIICHYTALHIPASCMKAVRTWLGMLKEAGIDLYQYGQKENQLLHEHHRQVKRSFIWDHRWKYSGACPHEMWYLLGFKIGPNAEDWDIWWAEPTDQFAGAFWALVEEPPLHIPGQWVEMDTLV